MKYDKQCAKQILEYIEAQNNLTVTGAGFKFQPISFTKLTESLSDFSPAEIMHNLFCLLQANYIDADVTTERPFRVAAINLVTIPGHEYLEKIS